MNRFITLNVLVAIVASLVIAGCGAPSPDSAIPDAAIRRVANNPHDHSLLLRAGGFVDVFELSAEEQSAAFEAVAEIGDAMQFVRTSDERFPTSVFDIVIEGSSDPLTLFVIRSLSGKFAVQVKRDVYRVDEADAIETLLGLSRKAI